MSNLIQPKLLKGFRDFLPAQQLERDLTIEKLTEVFRNFGFVPIDTPALEYSEILLRKSGGETEKQVFRFSDNGGRDVSMRFDLTVPFARFVAEHNAELYFPFKRYHIAKVWRGEKPQAGRYREFMQCDFDIVGSDSASSDFEILNLMKTALNAIGVEKIVIHISHRGIFNRFLEKLGIKEKSEEVLRIVDKLAKSGKAAVTEDLTALAGAEKAVEILNYISGGKKGEPLTYSDFEETLAEIEKLAGGSAHDTERMREIYSIMKTVGIEKAFVLDPSITRGLDYYTGIVYETFLTDYPQIGSVCSGGRYGNLTGLYMKEQLSGVGSSIGLDRLLAGLEKLGLSQKKASFTKAIIFAGDSVPPAFAYKTAQIFMQENIPIEVFPEPKKLNRQYDYAEKKEIEWGIFLPAVQDSLKQLLSEEIKNIKIKLKYLPDRSESEITVREALQMIRKDKR